MSTPVICYTVKEVADVTGLSVSTIRKLTRNCEIPHIKVGRRIIYPVTAVHEWLFANTIGSIDPEKGGGSDG